MIAKNHSSTTTHPTVVSVHLQKEKKKGRLAGPFDHPPFPDLHCSPLAVIEKKEKGTYRLIHDLSFPQNSVLDSINAGISKNFTSVQYETLDHVIQSVLQNGKGSLIAKADIESAFRIIPIAPKDYHLLGFSWEDKFWYDRCLPMGCATSCQIFEKFSCAVQWIMKERFGASDMSHILDDFIFVGPAKSHKCQTDLNNFLSLAAQVEIPIKNEKTVQPSAVVDVHGVELDTIKMETRLPLEKITKIRSMLETFLLRKKVTLRELQSLLGLLNFATKAIVPGRAFSRRLIQLTVGVSRPGHRIRLNREAKADLLAWKTFLKSFNGRTLFCHPSLISSNAIRLYTDASSKKGYAAVLGAKWFWSLAAMLVRSYTPHQLDGNVPHHSSPRGVGTPFEKPQGQFHVR